MIKVILVEDEALIREGLRDTVPWEAFGCQVIGEAANGLQGMEMIQERHPDIVITDIRMPDKSGLEMIQELQEQVKCHYIILSGYDEFAYARKAIKLGVKGYLLKPIDDEELEEVLLKTVQAVTKSREEEKLSQKPSIHYNDEIKNALCDKYLGRACQMIREEYMKELTLKHVADALHISESYLGKLFRSKTEMTFLDFLTLYRIKAAIELLEQSNLKVYEIADAVGYGDAKYFSKLFQKIVGIKPTEYRNGYQLDDNHILKAL